MRDIVDGQLRTVDGWRVGRATDVQAEWRPDGSLVMTRICLGPQAHAGRIGRRLWGLADRLLGGRFDHCVDVGELEEIGPTLQLRRRRDEYELGRLDRWIVERLLRFIPGYDK